MNGGYRDATDEPEAGGPESWEELREDLSEAVSGRGRAFLDAARKHAADYAESRKAGAAQSVEEVAHSLRESGRAFEDTPHIRAFVDSAAAGLEDLASDIRDRDFADLYAEVEDFARRRPAAVAAGAGIAGFLVARFLKSSADRRAAREQRRYMREAWERRRRRARPGDAGGPDAVRAGYSAGSEIGGDFGRDPGDDNAY